MQEYRNLQERTNEDLVIEYQSTHNEELFRALLEKNTGLLHIIVMDYKIPKYEIEDLLSESYIALIKAVDNFDPTRGVTFTTALSDTSVNEKIQKDLDKLERKRTKLLEAYLEDFISKDDYKAKYEAIEGQIEEKKKLLVPVEENEDIKVIESVLQNIDDEIDAYVKTLDMEESKVDFLIEHTKRITVLENRDIIIELDLVAGAIIAGKDFLLYVHDTMSLHHGRICNERFSKKSESGVIFLHRLCRN